MWDVGRFHSLDPSSQRKRLEEEPIQASEETPNGTVGSEPLHDPSILSSPG